MERKLIPQGPSSITISIPKKWIDAMQLSGGNSVQVTPIKNKLIITAQEKKLNKPVDFDLSITPVNFIHDVIISMYKSGLTDINITGLTKEKHQKVKNIVQNSIGFEIFEKEETRVRIIDLSVAKDEHLDKSEQQIYWKLLQLLEEIKNETDEEYINTLDLEINKLAYFIQRNVIKKYDARGKFNFIFTKAILLEQIGDSFRNITKQEFQFIPDIKNIISLFQKYAAKDTLEIASKIKQQIKKLKASSSLTIKYIAENLNLLLENEIAKSFTKEAL